MDKKVYLEKFPNAEMFSSETLVKISSGTKMVALNRAKFEAAKIFCSRNNLQFIVLTERDFKITRNVIASLDEDIVWIKK